MRRAILIAAAGGLLAAAAPAQADWTAGVADLQTVNATDVLHDIAVDDAGNGLAVWEADLGARTAIRARRYDAAAGLWETPIRELSLSSADNRKPTVVMDRAGNAFALWQRYTGEGYVLQARRYDRAAAGWESASTTLSVAGERVLHQTLAFEADGDAVAAWTGDGVVRARRYDAAAGAWESTSAPLSSDAGGAADPAVAVDAKGTAMVAWEADGTIEAKRYDAAEERWPATPTRLSPGGEAATGVRLGVDEAGRVQAVWSASEAGGTFVESRRFDTTWEPATPLTPKTGIAYSPQLATAPGGSATVVWFALADGKYVVRARRWEGTRWDAVANLSTPSTNAWSPQLAGDSAGRALVVWRRPGTPSTIEARRFDGTSWQAGPIALSGTTNGEDPDVAVGPSGHAIALWQRPANGQVTLQARRYVAPPAAGPAGDTPTAPDGPGAAPIALGGPSDAPIVADGAPSTDGAPLTDGAPPIDGAPSTAGAPRASVPDAPEITRLRLRDLGRVGTALPRLLDSASGARIELRLSAPATLRFAFERQVAGDWRAVPGTFELPAVQRGDVRVRFSGRLGKTRTLATGRYRLRVIATDAHGTRSAPAGATFRLAA